MFRSVGFTAACLQTIAKGVRDPRLPWADTCARQASATRRPSSRIEDGEGAVGPRSATDSRISGMMFMHMRFMLLYVICLLHVYVCYMSSP